MVEESFILDSDVCIDARIGVLYLNVLEYDLIFWVDIGLLLFAV